MKQIRLVFLLSVLFFAPRLQAAHIIGGELSYVCTGGDNYDITLKVFRDCASSGAAFDIPAYIFIYDAAGALVNTLSLPAPSVTVLPVVSDNPCLSVPPGICVEEGIYNGTVNLPPIPGGYNLVYQRCCRNNTIINLDDPDDTGASYVATIPDTAVVACNSSPTFNNFPPIVICADDPIYFDHSATDPDGDSLVYSLCAPFVGASPMAPWPGPGTPPPAPPYPNVSYLPSFTAINPLTASPPLNIDPLSGLLEGVPTVPGQYVVGVCVEEYRDGVLIATHLRDFQFNVADCEPIVVASIPDFVLDCDDYTVTWDNMSFGADTFFWDFGDPTTLADTSWLFSPLDYTYPDTGTYTVTLIANPGFVCADTAYATIAIYPSLIADFSFVAGCSGTPVYYTDSSVSPFAGTITDWTWDLGDGTVSTDQNPIYQYADGGAYSVQLIVTTDKGCEDTALAIVDVAPGPLADFFIEDICQDETAVFDNLSSIITGTITDYAWDFGDGATSSLENPSYDYPMHGTYTVYLIVTSDNGCTDTAFTELLVGRVPFADAGIGDTVEYLDLVQLNGSGDGDFLWTPGTYLDNPMAEDPVFTAWETTTFILQVTSEDGCATYDTVSIFVLPEAIMGMPNAFSPNGDGKNDELSILYNDIVELYEYSVYNRWGQLVFATTNIDQGWDGRYNGKPQEMGSYAYFIRARGIEGEEFELKGTVLLIR